MLQGFRIETLAKNHDRERFRCASESLNDFIKRRAHQQNENDTTRVHVYADDHGRIAGFFSLSALSMSLGGLPPALTRGRPRLDVPATLLGRFAVDEDFAGRGLGKWLLLQALVIAYTVSQSVGSALVVLDVGHDASPGARHLYDKVGFVSLACNPERMVLPMSEVGKALTQ